MKLLLKSGIGYAKPGMPADGEILVAGDTGHEENRGLEIDRDRNRPSLAERHCVQV